MAKFNASQLITQRQQVSLLVRKELIDRAKDFNIILDDVSLTELSFSKEYAAAVESKQVAQQEAQRAAFIVEQAKQERQQKIVQAEGEAESALMISFSYFSQFISNIFFFPLYLKHFNDEKLEEGELVYLQNDNRPLILTPFTSFLFEER